MIININKQIDRDLMIRLNKDNIKLELIWRNDNECCYKIPNYSDYVKAKNHQISLGSECPIV